MQLQNLTTEAGGGLAENLKLQGNVMDIRNNVTETSRTNADVNGAGESGSESPPSRGSALFCYLFSTDEPTFDSMELEHDTEVLASDSASETSNPHAENVFDFD
ncbi:Lymphatic vessel endothelial hyaluronic acid receptor [Dirofilaria immitis]